jgi:uncharacterized glyoxalase superfamily protein PhnB
MPSPIQEPRISVMIKNRSVPSEIQISHIVYQDLPKAIKWLTRALGFTEHFRYGDPVSGAQLLLGKACVMVRQAPPGQLSPAQMGHCTQSVTIFVEDVDAHFRKVKAEGGRIVEEVHETEYGEYQFGVEDLEGHHWLFARHERDVGPEEWGAKISTR